MTFDEFKNSYGDKTPKEKLNLMLEQVLYMITDAVLQGEAHSQEERNYWATEQNHMWERIQWLKEEIEKSL